MADFLEMTLETKEVESMINRLLKKVDNPTQLLNVMHRYVQALTMKMFRGRRPDRTEVRGVRWPKNKPSTIESKRLKARRGALTGGVTNRPMVDSGRTRDSHKMLSKSKTGFVYGTRIKSKGGFNYPAMHNVSKYPWLFLSKKVDFPQFVKMTVDYLDNKLRNYTHYTRGQ